ncbi:F0F1 ATP synthase subunit alpha [Candidatus Falkowbacteria bacterium]|uniref:ATP synthase subunit alpha n=1 Tax=Candidatus Falkowbacteria bacterium CG10_big_fil_rev_8_21_14_0_10_37_18 TaxID=1974562 RepID=A0A2H0V914_9BACT|nr:F0F1 ATP synthase subunit alpha [Candidatus Falkowbacteria bacterium]NCQ12736.1 F0F1 ATP synthase subunit alpha [Candidatus Falkowbacteria bacterium]OIO05373.1 MAG: F0F1 ATP synthase subunit alpha [Candidatus Falkowbacteria bacterium CG1_02_37_21]PIR95604.1 MAG: F0F1 ATP synthase subunit alpha [Candidatus Falkowbacteria bacterium CG10_big_fil_rev_8_21_14_0_10_37_18]
MSTTKDFIVEQLKEEIAGFKAAVQEKSVGHVLKISDGIALVSGLSEAMMSEILMFKTDGGEVAGVALNLEESQVGVIVLGDYTLIKEGDEVAVTKRILEVPVGSALVGRVVNPLGEPLDGKGKITTDQFYPVEKIAPGVITRESVKQPLQTGVKAIDAMIPIGRGQRELIIGDRQIGKTALAIDTIINQKGQNVKCVYVAIGQKESKIANIVSKLEETGAMEYTTVVLAGASDPASLLYIAPYAGCAIAEYFLDKGEDVLIIYDDLSKHAVSYREISLLLRRPPGREAYPGDVFYLHSRLLERACKLNKDFGGGSITALPIIETQAGDISAYVPTNVISITDGQIFLEPELFYKGNRPAVNAGLSVSRVGSSAQIKAMKKVAGKMRLEAAQYRELAAFAQFGSDLDVDTKQKLERGKRLYEIFKQDQYQPLSVAKQVLSYYSLINGFMDNVPVEKIREFENGLHKAADQNAEVLQLIDEKKEVDEEVEGKLKSLIEDYKTTLDYLLKN